MWLVATQPPTSVELSMAIPRLLFRLHTYSRRQCHPADGKEHREDRHDETQAQQHGTSQDQTETRHIGILIEIITSS